MQPVELFISNLTEAFKMLGRDHIEVMEILTEFSARLDALAANGGSGGSVIVDGQPSAATTWSSQLIAEQLGFALDIANSADSNSAKLDSDINEAAEFAQFGYAYYNPNEKLPGMPE